jgi:hypothetical protein
MAIFLSAWNWPLGERLPVNAGSLFVCCGQSKKATTFDDRLWLLGSVAEAVKYRRRSLGVASAVSYFLCSSETRAAISFRISCASFTVRSRRSSGGATGLFSERIMIAAVSCTRALNSSLSVSIIRASIVSGRRASRQCVIWRVYHRDFFRVALPVFSCERSGEGPPEMSCRGGR